MAYDPLYLDPFYPEAQGVSGAQCLPPLHVARLGDASLRMLLGGWPIAVHLHHFLVQVLSWLRSFSRSNELLLQVRPETAGKKTSGAGPACLEPNVIYLNGFVWQSQPKLFRYTTHS